MVVELESARRTTSPQGFSIGGDFKPGDGLVFDEGHPEQDEQGGRIATVTQINEGRKTFPPTSQRGGAPSAGRFEVTFERGSVNLGAVAVGATVWRTDDPAIRRRLEASYARDRVARRVPLTATVQAAVGTPLIDSLRDDAGHQATVSWDQLLQLAQKHPLTESLLRDQFGRLGETPFERARVNGLVKPAGAMVPLSVLNDLRRQASKMLIDLRSGSHTASVAEPDVLENVRREIRAHFPAVPAPAADAPSLHVLVRTMAQLDAALAWRSPASGQPVASVYCDFEDVRKYKAAVAAARAAGAARSPWRPSASSSRARAGFCSKLPNAPPTPSSFATWRA